MVWFDTRCVLCCAMVVGSALAGPVTAAQEQAPGAVRAAYVDAGTPFEETRYEWRWRATAPMVAVTRVHAGGYQTDTEVGLVSSDAYRDAWTALHRCDALLAPEPPADGPYLRFERDSVTAFVADPYGAGLACMRVVRGLVDAVLDIPAYRNGFWEEGEFGTVQTRTDVPAWLFVDGRPTGLRTPVMDLRVEPGERVLRWRAVGDDAFREATITVQPGQTTTINVELRPERTEPVGPSLPGVVGDDAGVS